MNILDLDRIKNEYLESRKNVKRRVVLCAGTGCVANGSVRVFEALVKAIEEAGLEVIVTLEKDENAGVYVSKSGCQGFCQMGPLLTIFPDNILYTKVKVEDVTEIAEKTLRDGKIIDRLLYVNPENGCHCKLTNDVPFYAKQSRFVIKQCGYLDPENINEYISEGGYYSAWKAANEMTSEQICKEMLTSGLRGRGGGGFPTGRKWDMARVQKNDKKYIICNGDEGDPGAFMDRSLLEGNPHSIIEGMTIAALAIGADEGYVYVRAEYPLAVKRVKKAVEDARANGILGKNIFGTTKSFDLIVMEGAGAFVCGEETALIASIEGKRGMPSPKPPFPAVSGLFGKPTIINNVETLSTIPLIFTMGADKFAKTGAPGSSGTKTFALTGHVANTGLIEVPFGATLRNIIGDIAGGVTNDDGSLCGLDFKAVQIGGPSGGCLTKEHLDLSLDFDSLKSVGAMVGSGGLVVMNQNTCMVNIAAYFMQFTQNESCGKCIPCREGTKQMLALLEDVMEGRATLETLDLLEELGKAVQIGSLCGLGKTAPNPVLSTLKQFREEYEAHVIHKHCPTGECKGLAKFKIISEKCKGCGICVKKCVVNAISGEKGKPYTIESEKCIKCGACISGCKFGAIIKG